MIDKTNNCPLKTPVALFIFNRPDAMRRVFEEIRRARPSMLLIVADGPRSERPEETEKCKDVRAIIDTVDWPCEVLKNYSDTNLGCKIRVSSGLDWVFNRVPEAIILEDDCLPNPSFFQFCEELLEKYRDDERIMHIGGCNFQNGIKRGDGSYYFSIYTHIWGWASWRRAWKYYDVEISSWRNTIHEKFLYTLFTEKKIVRYWKIILDKVQNGEIDTWDYQWAYAVWSNNGLAVLPQKNLISNIGFSEEGTHTKATYSNLSKMQTSEISPMIHPRNVSRDYYADTYAIKYYFLPPSFPVRIVNKIKQVIGKV
jgi:hypothetical protein